MQHLHDENRKETLGVKSSKWEVLLCQSSVKVVSVIHPQFPSPWRKKRRSGEKAELIALVPNSFDLAAVNVLLI
jgi:hypothetical protein